MSSIRRPTTHSGRSQRSTWDQRNVNRSPQAFNSTRHMLDFIYGPSRVLHCLRQCSIAL